MNTRSKVIEAYSRLGSKRAVARELGLHHSTVQDHLKRALLPPLSGAATSTLYRRPGPDGEAILEWVKTNGNNEQTLETIKSAFAEYKGAGGIYGPPHGPKDSFLASNLLTVYPIVDLHFGMYAWAKETGVNYTTELATELLRSSYRKLLQQGGAAVPETAIILNVGDYFHSDTNENKTMRSGNSLDADSRFERVLNKGIHLFLDIVNMALDRHQTVIIKCIKGNHDPYGTLALREALAAWFHDDPRVTVEGVGDPIWHYRFGRNLFAAIHGDKAKAADLPGTCAARFPEAWGQTRFRYGFVGHWHRSEKIEKGGMIVETFQTISPKDAWNTEMGFCSGRSIEAITYEADHGFYKRTAVNVINEEK